MYVSIPAGPHSAKRSILIANISTLLTASRAFLTSASAKLFSPSFCTCCSSSYHSWSQIASYKCIHSIKKKIAVKSTKNVTLIVIFHIEDMPFSIMKRVTDMQVYDYSIEVPFLITSLYSLSLFIRKTFECFPERRKEKKRKRKMNS